MRHRAEIDGLRAVAVLPVILFHAGFQALSGGFVGVDVFFVISGYLITTIILGEKTAGTFTLARFYERRARRILPALFVVMLACLPLAWLWLLPDDMKQFGQSLASVPAFASNVLFFMKTGYFATDSELMPLLHTWSLAVEEQYYLLFPLMLNVAWFLGRRAIAGLVLVLGVASLAIAQKTAVQHPAFAFFLLPARFWEILVGAAVALALFEGPSERVGKPAFPLLPVWARQLGAVGGLALILYSVFAFDRSTPFPSLYTLAPTLGTACIILFATSDTAVGKLLGHRSLVGVGQISYSVYLWHQPLFAFARQRAGTELSKAVLLTLCLLALVLAYVTWKFVETPFRARQRITRRQLVLFALGGSALFFSAGALAHVTKGFPTRFAPQTLTILRASQDERDSAKRLELCEQRPKGTFDPKKACTLGANARLVGALVGDSHAGAIASALGAALTHRGIGFEDASAPGCSPVVALYETDDDDHSCFDHNTNVLAALNGDPSLEYVVLISRWTMSLDGNGENLDNTGRKGNGFDNEEGGVEVLLRPRDRVPAADRARLAAEKLRLLRRRHVDTIRAYLDAHKKVILIYPVPEMGWDVPSYLAKRSLRGAHQLDPRDGSTSYALYKKRNKEAISILDSIGEHENLIRVRPDQLFCDTYVKDRCAAHLDGLPLYSDDDHLSNVGAKILVDAVSEHVPRGP